MYGISSTVFYPMHLFKSYSVYFRSRNILLFTLASRRCFNALNPGNWHLRPQIPNTDKWTSSPVIALPEKRDFSVENRPRHLQGEAYSWWCDTGDKLQDVSRNLNIANHVWTYYIILTDLMLSVVFYYYWLDVPSNAKFKLTCVLFMSQCFPS